MVVPTQRWKSLLHVQLLAALHQTHVAIISRYSSTVPILRIGTVSCQRVCTFFCILAGCLGTAEHGQLESALFALGVLLFAFRLVILDRLMVTVAFEVYL